MVEFLQPLMPGDRLQVSVDLHSTEGDLSRRSYEFLREGDEKPVARAAAAWHLLEKSSLRPAPFPSGLASRLNEGAGYPLPLALEMPALSPPAPEPLSLRYQVSWGDISVDYQQSYRAWVDLMIECGLRSGVRYGWTAQRSQEMDKIFVARKLWLALDEPARHGDELSITTWLAEPGRSTITRQYTAAAPAGRGEHRLRANPVGVPGPVQRQASVYARGIHGKLSRAYQLIHGLIRFIFP